MNHRLFFCIALTALSTVLFCSSARALDDAHRQKAAIAIQRGITYLRQAQQPDGSWTKDFGPAITALCITPMLDTPGINSSDPTVNKALDYILSCVQSDGSIQTGMLASYNTSISVSALSRLQNHQTATAAVRRALDHLRASQWQTGQVDPQGASISENHPYYGGVGYGKHGRPDMSNTQFMIQAFQDAGVDCNDPAIQRALVFLQHCQAVEGNQLFDANTIPRDGGFIYATSVNKDSIGVPESKANQDMIDEAKAGRPVSGLRTYGSITYAGFKSYVYADLDNADERVAAAYAWIKNNYTVAHNPGLPQSVNQQGFYYYCMTFAKALDAWGEPTITTSDQGDRDWANDLIDALSDRQKADGSWMNAHDRWVEGDPNLVTAYSLIALTHAMGR